MNERKDMKAANKKFEEQARLIRFTAFGASDLANGIFLRPGETAFRPRCGLAGCRHRGRLRDTRALHVVCALHT